jgi:hypothetical protein
MGVEKKTPKMPTFSEAILEMAFQADHVHMEILLALIGHLHDRRLIDKIEIVRLLQERIEALAKESPGDLRITALPASIDWLKRLGTGKAAAPPTLN